MISSLKDLQSKIFLHRIETESLPISETLDTLESSGVFVEYKTTVLVGAAWERAGLGAKETVTEKYFMSEFKNCMIYQSIFQDIWQIIADNERLEVKGKDYGKTWGIIKKIKLHRDPGVGWWDQDPFNKSMNIYKISMDDGYSKSYDDIKWNWKDIYGEWPVNIEYKKRKK